MPASLFHYGIADDIPPPISSDEIPDPDPFYFVHEFYKNIAEQALSHTNVVQDFERFFDSSLSHTNVERILGSFLLQALSRLSAAQALEWFLHYVPDRSRDDRTVVCLFNTQKSVSGDVRE